MRSQGVLNSSRFDYLLIEPVDLAERLAGRFELVFLFFFVVFRLVLVFFVEVDFVAGI